MHEILARFGILASVAAAFATTPAQAAVCEVHRRPLVVAADASVDMIVKSGKDCRVRYPSDEGFEAMQSEIVDRPYHGDIRVSGTFDIYYRSNPGYKGPDRFSFTLCGITDGRQGCSEVRVKVNVR